MQLNMMLVDEIISNALREDIGTGDLTTLATVPADAVTEGIVHAKEEGVVAGLPVAARVFQLVDPRIEVTIKKGEGEKVNRGDVLAVVAGPAQAVLAGERVALNLLQRMSGIATKTRKFAELIADHKAVVIDTRKTTPGLRTLEKYAVSVGGGRNHRFGLYDGILIKDNHIKVAGGIGKAVAKARSTAPHTVKIEVEVENLAGVREALAAGADIIMLDNMAPQAVAEAVRLIGGQATVEVSGGVNEHNIVELARTGVDLISVGALTHSVKALDISLDVGEIK